MCKYFLAVGQHVPVGSNMKTPLISSSHVRILAFDDSRIDTPFRTALQEDGFELVGKDWLKSGHFSRSKKAENFLELYNEPLWMPWNYSPLELDVVQYFLDFAKLLDPLHKFAC